MPARHQMKMKNVEALTNIYQEISILIHMEAIMRALRAAMMMRMTMMLTSTRWTTYNYLRKLK